MQPHEIDLLKKEEQEAINGEILENEIANYAKDLIATCFKENGDLADVQNTIYIWADDEFGIEVSNEDFNSWVIEVAKGVEC